MNLQPIMREQALIIFLFINHLHINDFPHYESLQLNKY